MIGFIINPQSGHGKGTAVWHQVQQLWNKHPSTYVYRITAQAYDATHFAIQLIQEHNIETLIVIGGDGTIHEVANGIWRCLALGHTCVMGVIPAGTGNDYAKAHGIPTDVRLAVALLMGEPSLKRLDVIRYDEQHDLIALNSVGVGFDGLVAHLIETSRYKKMLNRFGLGKLIYFLTMFKVFWVYQPSVIRLTVDGVLYELPDTWFVVTANISYFGGSMKICPHAAADDGVLDVVVIQSSTRLRLLPLMLSVYKGMHIHHPAVTMYRGKHIEVSSTGPLMMQADGEQAGITPLNATIIAGAIQIIVKGNTQDS